MAGIFFSGGLPCTLTVNAACGIETTGDDCPALYYPPKCNVSVEPLQMNAIISEIANAINAFGALYDCSRLDNLKAALQKARSICDLPPFADAPDLDDRIAGCFDNTSSTVTVQQLVNLVLSETRTLCELPQAGGIVDNDTLAGCIGGAEARVSVATLRGVLGGGISGAVLQSQLFNQWRAGGLHNFSTPTEGREAFVFWGEKQDAGAGGYIVPRAATGGGSWFYPTRFVNSSTFGQSPIEYIEGSFPYPPIFNPREGDESVSVNQTWCTGFLRPVGVVFKKNGQWYGKSGDVIVPMGGDDGVIRFQSTPYGWFKVWSATLI